MPVQTQVKSLEGLSHGTSEPARESTQEAATSGSEQPNPFWSERASDEFRLRQSRPLGLAEFDDVQLEPDYQASEAGRSAGYASVVAGRFTSTFDFL